ncbi:MAG: PD-(D/E)XK nuclease family protein, partial [Myxococcales bacterium]|nr:PD-(D/E)XK nuclease family protein [Myxococcales bacterium]
GVAFPDAAKLLGIELDAWRRGVLAARQRVVFVVPSTVCGAPMGAHALWDEIAARLGLDQEETLARIASSPHALLAERDASIAPVAPVSLLELPEGRPMWSLPGSRFARDDVLHTSATALDKLATCPLRFVLEQHAKLRAGALARVADGPLLNGSLGHRLVEELHLEGAFALEEDAFAARAEQVLEALVRTEAATLLLEGAAFERAQLVPQLLRGMRALFRFLRENGWRIAAVEESVETSSSIGTLHGRIDVRLENDIGKQAVLDLKWGESTYRALVEGGRAVQLAAYVHAIRAGNGKRSLPPAAYFALQSGKVITADERIGAPKTLDGATLGDTWARVERTARAVQSSLRDGKVYVAATRRALPLLDALGIPEGEQAAFHTTERADDACKYCEHPTICGAAWEGVR